MRWISQTSRLRRAVETLVASLVLSLSVTAVAAPLEIGNRREIFADRYLVENIRGVQLTAHEPRREQSVLKFDAPWEGPFSGYVTLIHDGAGYRVYYRGKSESLPDGVGEVTCVAESEDGMTWSKPKLGLVDFNGSRENNVILAQPNFCHNFSPVLDQNPAAPASQRYKALAGTRVTGLAAFTSADGLRWERLQEMVPYPYMFDSQNLAFWSPSEGRYVAFFRVFKDKIRRICRAESDDFVNWRNVTLMEYRGPEGGEIALEQLYTNQTHPYFRAPHLYVALSARFMPGRRVLTDEQAQAIQIPPKYLKDTSDSVFMTSRGGAIYDRTFPGAFIRPGIGAQNWVSRSNYPALNEVPTGPTEMSVFVNEAYAQPTAHLRRYSLRLDGYASLRADYEEGEMVTKPLRFEGTRMLLNFSTSAAGGIRVEIQDAAGKPLPGFSLAESQETIGNEIERAARWNEGEDVSKLSGQIVRLRFVMRDADLFALQFR
jgi:hypothetical protein